MNKLPITLISHFYNEEYLLPFWIEWHKRLGFKKVIMINYDSTDKSVEIIQKLAPEWEIRTSVNRCFEAIDVDKEVMEIEKEMTGWKICLNTTEFFIPSENMVQKMEGIEEKAIGCRVYSIINDTDDFHPQNLQEFVKPFDKIHDVAKHRRTRYLHNCHHGKYRPGRHASKRSRLILPIAYIAWSCYYPWNDFTLKRKLQIKDRIPSSDVKARRGVRHMCNEEEIEAMKQEESCRKVENREYTEVYDYLMRSL